MTAMPVILQVAIVVGVLAGMAALFTVLSSAVRRPPGQRPTQRHPGGSR